MPEMEVSELLARLSTEDEKNCVVKLDEDKRMWRTLALVLMVAGAAAVLYYLFGQPVLRRIAHVVGSPITVLSSVAMLATGFWFSFSDAWWLWVDRAVYLATLLIALIVQAAQNRDTEAMQRKLDELIRAVDKADDRLQGIERQ